MRRHAVHLLNCDGLASEQLLHPLLVAHQSRWLIGYRAATKRGHEPLEVVLEGLEEALNHLGASVVAFGEDNTDAESREDTSEFLRQVVPLPLLIEQLGAEGSAIIEIDVFRSPFPVEDAVAQSK